MNKQDLIEAILANKEAGIESKAAAARAVDAVLDGITAGIKKDGLVQLIGFGTFSVKERAAREGRNPLPLRRPRLRSNFALKAICFCTREFPGAFFIR